MRSKFLQSRYRLQATIHTQTIHGLTCLLMQPAPREATHEKLTSGHPLGHPFSQRIVCFLARSLPFVCHRQATVQMFRMARRLWLIDSDTSLAGLVGAVIRRIVRRGLVELAIKRGAADFQSAGNLGHLPAVMRDRETDDFV